ncbi:alanine--tRNA ligase [Candidatus Shapirobacteria bacterium]|nr:alanine--tRNA ligase [Candidatus Shapirobacteria bacterium]
MTAKELREKYFRFFEERGHKRIPSASLVPENDPSVLFTTAGMHPLVPYLLGQPHPLGKRIVSVQKCLRTDDIDNVGDGFHHTFFEMLGNWSLGDPASPCGFGQGGYWKKEAIEWSYEFLTKILNFGHDQLSVTCFSGDGDAPKDEESARVWESLNIPRKKIYFFGKKENWWGPVGATGPCGPDSEMFIDTGKPKCSPHCDPSCQCGKYIEVWNDVFMEYNKTANGRYEPLKQKNVDTGMGVERVVALTSGYGEDDYQTDLFIPIIRIIEQMSGKSYEAEENKKPIRIIVDHLRAAVFLVASGVTPSNKERGYVLRRLIRRAAVKMMQLNVPAKEFIPEACRQIIEIYKDSYLSEKDSFEIHPIIGAEADSFVPLLHRGNKLLRTKPITGQFLFDLHQTYGFPFELSCDLLSQWGKPIDQKIKEEFEKESQRHQQKSRVASAGMFKGGLADHSEQVTKLHTATHLLQAALRKVVGPHIYQAGSNITAERLRFDFPNQEKLSEDQLARAESLVNEVIKQNWPISMEIMDFAKAKKEGAGTVPGEKYPEKVKVYKINDFSAEVCGGPHADFTGTLGRFKIIKEEGAGSGTRRIYATLS